MDEFYRRQKEYYEKIEKSKKNKEKEEKNRLLMLKEHNEKRNASVTLNLKDLRQK